MRKHRSRSRCSKFTNSVLRRSIRDPQSLCSDRFRNVTNPENIVAYRSRSRSSERTVQALSLEPENDLMIGLLGDDPSFDGSVLIPLSFTRR